LGGTLLFSDNWYSFTSVLTTAIAARLAFKFPRDLVRRVADKPPGSDGWPLFNRILRHELNPKWQTLFS
jgi:hypothetical protein